MQLTCVSLYHFQSSYIIKKYHMALSQESAELYNYWLKPSWVTPYAPYSLIGF